MGLLSLGAAAFKVGFGIGDALFNSGKRKKRERARYNAEMAEYNAEKKKAEQEKAEYRKREDQYHAEQREHDAWMREQAKYRSPQENIVSQAAGAREAAEKHGFNPLTLLAYGQGGGSQLGGFSSSLTPPSMSYSMGPSSKPTYTPPPPPLASLQAISGDIAELDDWASGDAGRRRIADQLQIDLARVNLDRARAEVQAIGGRSPLGRQAMQAPSGGAIHTGGSRLSSSKIKPAPGAGNPLAPGREVDRAPLTNSPGFYEMQNAMTGNRPIVLPGDGEPSGFDEVLTGVIVGGPQIIAHKIDNVLEGMYPGWRPFKPFNMSAVEFGQYKIDAAKERTRRSERPDTPVPQLSDAEWEQRFGKKRGARIGPFDDKQKPMFK